MLIHRIYQTDPLLCPTYAGAMKILAFIEARQSQVVQKILEHYAFREDPTPLPGSAAKIAGSGTVSGRCNRSQRDGTF